MMEYLKIFIHFSNNYFSKDFILNFKNKIKPKI